MSWDGPIYNGAAGNAPKTASPSAFIPPTVEVPDSVALASPPDASPPDAAVYDIPSTSRLGTVIVDRSKSVIVGIESTVTFGLLYVGGCPKLISSTDAIAAGSAIVTVLTLDAEPSELLASAYAIVGADGGTGGVACTSKLAITGAESNVIVGLEYENTGVPGAIGADAVLYEKVDMLVSIAVSIAERFGADVML